MLLLQNWLLSAVNNSGAVSPLMRATASNTPVMIPARAARSVTKLITFHCGAPSAAAASRNVLGTRRNMFSVVRITIGITSMDKASAPAQPEKCLTLTT
jgi:alpha-D-ribose 1-methylphosphonate 5-triphosphate synthase subunit PhnH